MKSEFKGLSQAEAKAIIFGYLVFHGASIILFSVAFFNLGEAYAHSVPEWLEVLVMPASVFLFLIAVKFFLSVHGPILKIANGKF